jgi:hypothetical protein
MGRTRTSGNLVSENILSVDITNDRVGIGSTIPTVKLDVNGDARITGILTVGTASVTINGNNNTIELGAGVTISSSGSATYTGILTAATFDGNLNNTVITNYAEAAVNVGTLSTTVTNNIGLSTGNVFYGNLPATAGIVTFSFTTGHTTDASSFTLYLTNAASGTPTLGWPAAVTFPGGTAPDRTTAANKTDIWTFSTFNNGTTWYGDIAMYNL